MSECRRGAAGFHDAVPIGLSSGPGVYPRFTVTYRTVGATIRRVCCVLLVDQALVHWHAFRAMA
jgi:hypothetical protein